VQVARYLREPASEPPWLDYENLVRALGDSEPRHPRDRVAGTRPREALVPAPDPTRREAALEFTATDMTTLTTYCRTQKVTLNTVFLAALATAIWTGPDLGVGLLLGEKTVRYPYRFAQTLGPFPDLWPIGRPAGGTDFPRMLAAIHNQVLQAMDVALPFFVLVRRTPWLAKELFNPRRGRWVFYQYFNEAPSCTAGYRRVAGLEFPDSFGEQSDIFGLHLQLCLDRGLLRARLSYRMDSFGQRDLALLVDRVRDVLRHATGQPVSLSLADSPEPVATGRLGALG